MMKRLHRYYTNFVNSDMGIAARQFWKGQWKQMFIMSFVFALLLLFLHVFVLASSLTAHASQTVKDKLGVYFYVKEASALGSGITQEQIASRIIKFKDELGHGGVHVQYFSKDDALKNLQKRMPNMITNFDAYGIDNPLPVTLYVTFDNQQQYEFVNQKRQEYGDILLSSSGSSNQDTQFSRNAHIINLLYVLQFFFGFIIASCVVVILLFLHMIIQTKFTAMYEMIHVQKLLGAPLSRLKRPFFYNTFLLLVLGYIMTVLLSTIFLYNLASIFPYLFGKSLAEVFGTVFGVKLISLFFEFIVLLAIA